MGAQGTTTIDFGAFPGGYDASVTVTGQATILSGSLVEAWIAPVATADHTADEHRLESIAVMAGDVVAGTGFTIYARSTWERPVPPHPAGVQRVSHSGGDMPKVYGQFTVNWVWN